MDVIIILFFVFGFLGFIMLAGTGVMFILWRRRKLIFTNFLSQNGQWERKGWYPNKISKDFEYDGETYKFDVKLCTRDNLNRPIAHYFKGNPNQQVFNVDHGNKHVMIGTHEISLKDFRQLMLSKVLRDIFSDGEDMIWFIVIIACVVLGTLFLGGMMYFYQPPVALDPKSNETIQIIAQGVRVALQR